MITVYSLAIAQVTMQAIATDAAIIPTATDNQPHEKNALRVLVLIEQSKRLRKQLPLFLQNLN